MKLGINGANMKPWPLEKQVVAAADAGFHGIEIWQDKLVEYLAEHDKAELVDLMRSHHIEPTTLCFVRVGYGDEQQPDRIKAMREIVGQAVGIGATSVAVCAARTFPADASKAELLRLAAEEAKILSPIAADQGVTLYLEPLGLHPVTPGPAEVLEIINGSGCSNLKIIFDVFHYYRSSVSLAQIAATPVERLGVIHVNDCEDAPKEVLNDLMRLYPTLGVLPAAEMIRIPRDQGFDGYITVEVFRTEYWERDPELAQHSMQYLKALLDQVPWTMGETK